MGGLGRTLTWGQTLGVGSECKIRLRGSTRMVMMITEIGPSGNLVGIPAVLIMLAKGRVSLHGRWLNVGVRSGIMFRVGVELPTLQYV